MTSLPETPRAPSLAPAQRPSAPSFLAEGRTTPFGLPAVTEFCRPFRDACGRTEGLSPSFLPDLPGASASGPWHPARKSTWLYAFGADTPDLRWGKGPEPTAWISADRPRAELAALGIRQLQKREASATPPGFRDLLLSIARSALASEAHA